MQCPVCKDSTLTMAERQGIEIDYCPKCRGVWLDRGELDKIIERSAGTGQETESPAPPRGESMHKPQHDSRYYDEEYKYKGHRKKRSGFLGDLFDFD